MPQETGNEDKGIPNLVRDSVKTADLEVSALSFPPDIRPIINPRSWSRPPRFTVGASDVVVNERIRKAFCAETRRPLVPLRSYPIPTPASFGESRKSLEARRAKLKRAGYRFEPLSILWFDGIAFTFLYSFHQIEGDNGHYRTNPETGAREIQVIAAQPIPIKNFPTNVIRVCCEEQGPTGDPSTKVVSFIAHEQVLAAFFAHLSPKLASSVTIARPNGYFTALVRSQWLPLFAVLDRKPDVYESLLEYVYEQDPETILRSLLGDRVFPQVSPCTEEIYQGTPRSISALPLAERRAAVQVQEEHSYGQIFDCLLFLDEIFDLADELGLESPPFWNALACVRRIVLDAGAISFFLHLKEMAVAEAAASA